MYCEFFFVEPRSLFFIFIYLMCVFCFCFCLGKARELFQICFFYPLFVLLFLLCFQAEPKNLFKPCIYLFVCCLCFVFRQSPGTFFILLFNFCLFFVLFCFQAEPMIFLLFRISRLFVLLPLFVFRQSPGTGLICLFIFFIYFCFAFRQNPQTFLNCVFILCLFLLFYFAFRQSPLLFVLCFCCVFRQSQGTCLILYFSFV